MPSVSSVSWRGYCRFPTFFLAFFLGLLLVFAGRIEAQSVITLSETHDYSIGGHCELFEDAQRILTIAQVAQHGRFVASNDDAPMLGFSNGAHWVRFTLRNTKLVDWVILVGNTRIDSATLYTPDGMGGYIASHSGERTRLKDRQISSKFAVFPLAMPEHEATTFYLRIISPNAARLALQVTPNEEFGDWARNMDTFAVVLLGMLLFATVFNILLLVIVRDDAYFWYVIHVIVLMLYTGYFATLLLERWFPLINLSAAFATTLLSATGATATQFLRVFLQTRQSMPVHDRFAVGYIACSVLLIACNVFGLEEYFTVIYLPLTLAASINSLIILGRVLLVTSAIPTRIYAVVQAVYLLAALLATLRGMFNEVLIISTAGVIEMMLFSLVLAARITLFREQTLEEQRRRELAEEQRRQQFLRNQELQSAKEEIERTNADITETIEYAQTIQQAILPTVAELRSALGEVFVLYKPQAIVSGDFYWLHSASNRTLLAVADCTGHGVPGAFMSMIGNELLNQIVIEQGITEPAAILRELHRAVRLSLRQKNDWKSNQDGMDVCLCSIEGNRVAFAGAKRPLYFVHNGTLSELKGDRVSIGGWQSERERTFKGHEITFSTSDRVMLYLTSDGFADQQNARREKFGIERLQALLHNIAALPVSEQAGKLERVLHEHHGAIAQRDDITVLGVRLHSSP